MIIESLHNYHQIGHIYIEFVCPEIEIHHNYDDGQLFFPLKINKKSGFH